MIAVLLLALAPVALCSPSEYIVGGSNVNIADYPWQGSYRTASGSHTCGCVYVGGTWSLTAGHCGGSSSYSMEYGNSNRGNGPYSSISGVTRHPNYGQGPGFTPNDIAVVASNNIQGDPTGGNVPADATNPETRGWITGWGRTCGSCALPVALQGANLDVISDAQCESLRGTSFQSSNMICVWDTVNQQLGACNGDSGGPLSVGNTIYGLTSWGSSGCGTNLPSVYNRVGAFNDWVCSTTSGGANGC